MMILLRPLLYQQNKKHHMPPLTWKEEPNDSQIGQLFFYLVAQQLEAIKLCMHPNPIVGMFMGGGGGGVSVLFN